MTKNTTTFLADFSREFSKMTMPERRSFVKGILQVLQRGNPNIEYLGHDGFEDAGILLGKKMIRMVGDDPKLKEMLFAFELKLTAFTMIGK